MTKRKEKQATHSTPIRLLPQFMHIERIMFACSCTSGSVGALLSTSRRRRIYGTARAKCPSATVRARVRLAAAAASPPPSVLTSCRLLLLLLLLLRLLCLIRLLGLLL